MRLPRFLARRRALPWGGLSFQLATLSIVVVTAVIFRVAGPTGLCPYACAVLPLLWATGILYLREDLYHCRRAAGIYNWRMTLSRILAMVNALAIVWGMATIVYAFR